MFFVLRDRTITVLVTLASGPKIKDRGFFVLQFRRSEFIRFSETNDEEIIPHILSLYVFDFGIKCWFEKPLLYSEKSFSLKQLQMLLFWFRTINVIFQ